MYTLDNILQIGAEIHTRLFTVALFKFLKQLAIFKALESEKMQILVIA